MISSQAGAADYVVTPCSSTELTTRVGDAPRRRDEPVPITDRGIHYASRYDVAAGTACAPVSRGPPKGHSAGRVAPME